MDKNIFEVSYTRGSGPGGQHKNKVETCVVITHKPTGFKERCQDTRSKLKNEKLAMSRLVSRLDAKKKKEEHLAQNDFRKEQITNTKPIRTYNYARNEVVDHITGNRANLKRVMGGDIDSLK
jgi:peptide chain release factor 1